MPPFLFTLRYDNLQVPRHGAPNRVAASENPENAGDFKGFCADSQKQRQDNSRGPCSAAGKNFPLW
jgi:hypothetical protein